MNFQEVIEQIASGAKKLQLCIPDEELNQPFVESSEPFVRIPVSAFCLKLAHDIWRETQMPCLHPPMLSGPVTMGPFPVNSEVAEKFKEAMDEVVKESQKSHPKKKREE